MREQKLGPYLLKNVVGRGGMGTVYRAEHGKTGDVCAVKALAPTFAHDSHFRARFESEIKALLKLDHPNIVRLISYGQEEGNLFFAMELVEGKSLFQMQRDGHRFDWREILKIAKDVAQGLRHAHDRGVIHRDLKPGNLLRSETGIYKITDFGIAKSFGTSQNTGENVLGTMDFMSPEQAKGQPVTIRSDLYSLGTVLFTLLSGKPPFKANSVEESLRNLTRVPPPRVSSVAPDVPDEIDQLIRQLMDKNPDNRVPTAQALLRKIDEVEQTLKNYSEAQTAHHPKTTNETFVMHEPGSIPTTEKHGKQEGTGDSPKTVRHTTVDGGALEAKSDPTKQVDYFNTVSDLQRKRIVGRDDSAKLSRGTIPLMIGLAAVVLLAGFGIFYALRTQPADVLFETITGSERAPDLVRDEIRQFINAYSDDERIEEVKQLDRIAQAIALKKKLQFRLNSANAKISQIEKMFVEIANMASSDPPTAFSRMNAFLTINANETDLTDSDRECIKAAKNYLIKIENDAKTEVTFSRGQIEQALDRASASDNAAALKTYQAVIELYQSAEWAEDLVTDARKRLKELSKKHD